METKFNGQAAVEQLKADLSAVIEKRQKTESDLQAARKVLDVNLTERITSAESEIRKLDSEIIDALAGNGDASKLVTRKGKLTAEIAAYRSAIASKPRISELQANLEQARKELASAVRVRMKPVSDAVAAEQMGLGLQVEALSNEWDTFLVAMDRLCGERIPIKPPLHLVPGVTRKEQGQIAIAVDALARAIGESIASRNWSEMNEARRVAANTPTAPDPRRIKMERIA